MNAIDFFLSDHFNITEVEILDRINVERSEKGKKTIPMVSICGDSVSVLVCC